MSVCSKLLERIRPHAFAQSRNTIDEPPLFALYAAFIILRITISAAAQPRFGRNASCDGQIDRAMLELRSRW